MNKKADAGETVLEGSDVSDKSFHVMLFIVLTLLGHVPLHALMAFGKPCSVQGGRYSWWRWLADFVERFGCQLSRQSVVLDTYSCSCRQMYAHV